MKIKIPNVVDVSEYLKKSVGQELKGFIQFMASASDEIITALQSNLTYADNFLCEIKQLSVRDGVEEIVRPDRTDRATEIRIRRVVDDTFYVVDNFGWKYNGQGNLVITVTFDNPFDPIPIPASTLVPLEIIIYYG